MAPIIIIIAILIGLLIRIRFISKMVSLWNSQLAIYKDKMWYDKGCSKEYLAFIEKHEIKESSYYFRPYVWSLKDIINDPFLLDDVLRQINKEKNT